MLKSTELYLDNPPTDITYPYLGVSNIDGAVVLFISPKTGVAVKHGEYTELGEYSKGWREKESFEFYQHKIILENYK